MKTKTMALVVVMVWCVMTAGICQAAGTANGTIKKNGLVWLKDAGCLGKMNWNLAMARAQSLKSGECGLTDGSTAGDWRLPTINELQSISASTSQFNNVQDNHYWSSTTYGTLFAGIVFKDYGAIYSSKNTNFCVWAVRFEP